VTAPPVLCVGILVADIFVPPLDRVPTAGELVATDDFLTQPGGCAANSAIALRRLGVDAAICGRVGDDPFGEIVLRELGAHGIDTRAVAVTPGVGTSKTVVLPVHGEDRRFIHTFGANASLTAADIPGGLLDAALVVYVGGYLVLPGLHHAELAERLREARAHGVCVILDVVVPSDARAVSLDAIAELLPLADYFVPNDDEAALLTGKGDPAAQARVFSDCGAHTVVVKLGERGVHVRSGEMSFDMPAPPVAVVEPSGAGDAFAAGLVVGILEGWELERTIRFASVVGASACTALGCWAGVSTRTAADAFVASHPLPALAR
jgi:sugar/nucleoside kinase (ribokinase family)